MNKSPLDLKNKMKKKIDLIIKNNKIVLFMKGNPEKPACGFSQEVVLILNKVLIKLKKEKKSSISYFYYDVTENIYIKEFIKEYSEWPTFPQLYINSKLIGGRDIVIKCYESEELYDIIIKSIED